jgi:dTDP-4-amino-4,6-dideoxygalactose transaminase
LGWSSKNDYVLVSPITFAAGANAAELNNSTVNFVDIDPHTYCLDPNKLEDKVKEILKKQKKVKSVIATDFAGHPCDWKALKFLAEKYNFTLINDNCHAFGAKYSGKNDYAVNYADIACVSFHPVKHITTGEGGAILTNSSKFFNQLLKMREHGILREKKNIWWDYDIMRPSLNFRMSEIQAALGTSQLKKINIFLKERRKIAEIYNHELKKIDFIKIPTEQNCRHAYHLYPILVDFKKIYKNKKELINNLYKNKIKVQVHYKPTFLFSYYKKKYKFIEKNFPVSINFFKKQISLPIFYNLDKRSIYKTISILKKA